VQKVRSFRSIRAAKDYLAGQIAAEAEREGVPLSEVERKMLYFSETDWTLPDMTTVSAEFDRDFGQDEYEKKIGGLVRQFLTRDEAQVDQEAWDDAVLKLSDEDHYLLVLIDSAPPIGDGFLSRWPKLSLWLPSWVPRAKREPNDLLRLLAVALALGVLIPIVALLVSRFK
jgi:hypothetical protein